MNYGLIGGGLSHSYSKPIHEKLANYTYNLYPLNKAEFDDFMQKKAFTAINVTIPYKQSVIPYCTEIDSKAKAIGAVNTIINKNGILYAYNTDFDGIEYALRKHNISLKNKVVLILGDGGTAKTMRAVAKWQNAKQILTASRSPGKGSISYALAQKESAVQVIMNASPVGMYPNSNACPISLTHFPALEAVFDAIYNPLQTQLILQAKQNNIPAIGGLEMLIAQAKFASELFTGTPISNKEIDAIYVDMLKSIVNVSIIGLPGCGKTYLGTKLASRLNREFIDMDEEIIKRAGKAIPDIFAQDGETAFRNLESAIAKELGQRTGLVISTGGGVIKRPENITSLKQNGFVIFINCPAERLVFGKGRPLSQSLNDVKKLEAERVPIYNSVANCIVQHDENRSNNNGLIFEAFINGLRQFGQ